MPQPSKNKITTRPAPAKRAAPAEDARAGDAVHTIFTRNAFYHDGYRAMLKIAGLQLVAILVLLGVLVGYFIFSQPRYRFFATTADGRIVDIVPLDQPYRSDVVAWASQAAAESMTFAYTDYQMRLQGSAKYFTTRGWDTYIDALNRARVLETMDNAPAEPARHADRRPADHQAGAGQRCLPVGAEVSLSHRVSGRRRQAGADDRHADPRRAARAKPGECRRDRHRSVDFDDAMSNRATA